MTSAAALKYRYTGNALNALAAGDIQSARHKVDMARLAERKRLQLKQQDSKPTAQSTPANYRKGAGVATIDTLRQRGYTPQNTAYAPIRGLPGATGPIMPQYPVVTPIPPLGRPAMPLAPAPMPAPAIDAETLKQIRGYILAGFAVLTWLRLSLLDGLQQITDVGSASQHLPVIIMGLGYVGVITTTALRGRVAIPLIYTVILWIAGLWT